MTFTKLINKIIKRSAALSTGSTAAGWENMVHHSNNRRANCCGM